MTTHNRTWHRYTNGAWSEAMEAKVAVRERDGQKCVDCGKTQEEFSQEKLARKKQMDVIAGRIWKRELRIYVLDVHRKEADGPYSLENCVTLCRKCHRRRHALMRNERIWKELVKEESLKQPA